MTSKPNDGGLAFPPYSGSPDDDPRNKIIGGGMSLRDWFAGQALAGYIASSAQGAQDYRDERENYAAFHAYLFADAMIARREII